MFMDRAEWHRSQKLKVSENIFLEWLPPYSRECKPSEYICEDIRENWFKNYVFNSMDAIKNNLVDALVSLENGTQKLFGLTGFDWIICNNYVCNLVYWPLCLCHFFMIHCVQKWHECFFPISTKSSSENQPYVSQHHPGLRSLPFPD